MVNDTHTRIRKNSPQFLFSDPLQISETSGARK